MEKRLMPGNLEKYRGDLKELVRLGEEMLIDISLRDAAIDEEQKELTEKIKGSLEREYQHWYTEACAVIRQLIPDRAAEFERLYLGDGKRKTVDASTYNIQDWLTGRRAPLGPLGEKPFNDMLAVSMRLKTQLEILKSAEARFQSSLFDIRQLLQADLFDSELDACRELAARGFLRAAGAIAGVILEKHLRQVALNYQIVVCRREPTINDFNDQLKNAGVLDVPAWRQIQRLGDVRNLCGHSKHRDPSNDEVEELIRGVDHVIRTLF
jgi:hypothetical protein